MRGKTTVPVIHGEWNSNFYYHLLGSVNEHLPQFKKRRPFLLSNLPLRVLINKYQRNHYSGMLPICCHKQLLLIELK
jgi:hypothetical protein